MSASPRALDTLTSGYRWLVWRVLVFLVVVAMGVAMGVAALNAGVGLSERRDVHEASFLAQLYDGRADRLRRLRPTPGGTPTRPETLRLRRRRGRFARASIGRKPGCRGKLGKTPGRSSRRP